MSEGPERRRRCIEDDGEEVRRPSECVSILKNKLKIPTNHLIKQTQRKGDMDGICTQTVFYEFYMANLARR